VQRQTVYKYFNTKQPMKPKYLDTDEMNRLNARYYNKLQRPNLRNVEVFLFKTLYFETGVNAGK
jgi:hypothetical protein